MEPEVPARRKNGWVTLSHGDKRPTLELVELLRSYRGRLTRKLMCRALGHGGVIAYNAVSRLCREYQITTADGDDLPPVVPPKMREGWKGRLDSKAREAEAIAAQAAVAQARLTQEIAAHKAHVQRGVVIPPYKPGLLEW